MIKGLKELCIGIIDLIYPLYCVICRSKINSRELGPLCLNCFNKIHWNLPPFCSICGRNIPVELVPENTCLECRKQKHYFDHAWSVALYKGTMRECIHKFKYERHTGLIYFFEKILNDFIDKFISMEKIDYILPVPLHTTKLREREFNQAFLIAQPIAKRFRKGLLLKSIYRKRFTLPQSELSAKERLKNIRGAFVVKSAENIMRKNILIIDDIFTTGSTVDECARLLKTNGANSVEVLTIAC